MWDCTNLTGFFKNSFLEPKSQNYSNYYPVQESHGSRTPPGAKCHTRNMMQGLCSGYYQGSLHALRIQWQAPCVGLWQHLCWNVDTRLSCNVLLPSLVARTAHAKARPGWWLPTGDHPQGHLWAFVQGSALMVWTPEERITGMSRALVFLWGGSWTQWALLTSSDMIDHFSGHAWCSGIQ